MLVLSRHAGQEIRIGKNIRVTVLEFNGSQVRLGFDAPPEVVILRGELEWFDKNEGGSADVPAAQ